MVAIPKSLVVQLLVAVPRSLVVLLLAEQVATNLSSGVVALVGLDGLKVKAAVMNPISYWIGSYTCLVGPYLDDGSSYWLPSLGSVVLSASRGAGMAFD